MKVENIDGIALKESDIREVYGETIFERGMDYFEDDRVTSVIKLKNKLTGEVEGSDTYRTDVNLNNLQSECSCPYGINCKHGVAVLLQYLEGEYSDADEITNRLDRMSREELRKVIDTLISVNPSNMLYLGVNAEKDEKTDETWTEVLDKQIESRLNRIKYSNADAGFVDDFARFIKANETVMTKEQVFHILEFLVDNCEEYGYFYNDYSDSYYGEEIFENLCDAFAKKQLEKKDFARLKNLSERDNYEMLGTFLHRLSEVENPANLKDFEDYVHEFLDESSYVEFLINCGLTEKARMIIESSESLGEESRFRLYLRIDEGSALEFAFRNGAFSSLIKYYHEKGAYDEAVRLFVEVTNDRSNVWKLKNDPILYRNIFDSIKKREKKKDEEKVLRAFFEKCFSFQYFGLCADAGLMLGDKRLLRELINEKSGYDFDVEKKVRVLEYLKEDYQEDVIRELKRLASSLINQTGNHQYNKATECVFLLRSLMDEDKWNEYVKGLYEVHSGKRNLWKEFTNKGIYLKKRKGEVTLDEKSYDSVKRR